MTFEAVELVERARRESVHLTVEDGKLQATGPESAVDALMPFLRESSDALKALLGAGPEARHADLCALLRKDVRTKFGTGRLWQVFTDRVAVVLSPGGVTFMSPLDVLPLDGKGA